MGHKDDDSSYSGDDEDEHDNKEEDYEDASNIIRGNGGSEEELSEKPTSEVPAANKKRPRPVVDRPMNDDLPFGEETVMIADTKRKKQEEHVIPLKPDELFVDWGNVLLTSAQAKSWWVYQPFINHNLPLIEIDKLIGYSTHITTYHHPSTTATTSTASANGTHMSHGRTFLNPLLGLPNIPIRPTLLKQLILDPATKLTSSHIHHQNRHQKIILDNDTDDDDDDNVEDPAQRPKKQQKKGRKKKRSDQSLFYERFHHSAAVAIGMFTEEMLTASLLPLAQQYVQYCRHHDDADENNDCRKWTLPPEEAILKLFQDSNMIHSNNTSPTGGSKSSPSSLLSTRVPTRSIVSGAIGTSMLNQPSRTDHERIAYHNWCRTTRTTGTTEQQWIEHDPSYFQCLIQHIPSVLKPVSRTRNTVDPRTTPMSRQQPAARTTPIPDSVNITNQMDFEI